MAVKTQLIESLTFRNLINVKALTVFHDATAGCEYAESFMLLKEIQ